MITAALDFLATDARVQAQTRAVIGWCFGGGWSLQHRARASRARWRDHLLRPARDRSGQARRDQGAGARHLRRPGTRASRPTRSTRSRRRWPGPACGPRSSATTRSTRSRTRRTRSTTRPPRAMPGRTCSRSSPRSADDPGVATARARARRRARGTLRSVIGLVLSCEHASWTLPPGVDLGVDRRRSCASQAGWDHGAFEIAEQLGEALGLPVHTGAFTRMFVDLNRAAGSRRRDPADELRRAGAGQRGPDARRSRGAARDVPCAVLGRGRAAMSAARLVDPGAVPAPLVAQLRPVARSRAAAVRRRRALRSAARVRGRAGRAPDVPAPRRRPRRPCEPALQRRRSGDLHGAAHAATRAPRYAGIQLETSHAVTSSPGGCARVAAAILPFLRGL